MDLEFSRRIFEKKSSIKFHENPWSGGQVLHADGQTDGRVVGRTDKLDEANVRLSQFCERVYK
jgi:hypothetical protein